MHRLALLLLALPLCACPAIGGALVFEDDDDAANDDDAADDDDDTPTEDPPRYADCLIEQQFALLAQNRFEFSVHHFDSEGHNARTDRYFDGDSIESIDWRTFDGQDQVVLIEASEREDGQRRQTLRYERDYDALDRQTAAVEYNEDDDFVRAFEVIYEDEVEEPIKTIITTGDGRIDRVQHWTWDGDQVVKQENDLEGDGSIDETLVWEREGDVVVAWEMDRNGDGNMDLHRDYEYDDEDNLLQWELFRIQQGDLIQWSEFSGSCYE
jgi:hypothetical protein